MIDFAADTAAIFDDVLAVDATYTPDGGSPVAVRVIPRQSDQERSFGGAQLVSDSSVFLLAVAAVAAPASGDTLAVDGATYQVQGEPMRDDRRLFWRLEARLAD